MHILFHYSGNNDRHVFIGLGAERSHQSILSIGTLVPGVADRGITLDLQYVNTNDAAKPVPFPNMIEITNSPKQHLLHAGMDLGMTFC